MRSNGRKMSSSQQRQIQSAYDVTDQRRVTSYANYIYLCKEDDIFRTLECIDSKQPYYTTLGFTEELEKRLKSKNSSFFRGGGTLKVLKITKFYLRHLFTPNNVSLSVVYLSCNNLLFQFYFKDCSCEDCEKRWDWMTYRWAYLDQFLYQS